MAETFADRASAVTRERQLKRRTRGLQQLKITRVLPTLERDTRRKSG